VHLTIKQLKGICPSTPPIMAAADVRVATAAGFVRQQVTGSSG
jgi:hypothetical protein